ncbi:MAG TPA: cupin domain-containing protein [Epulopiscium sp.]|nr:cupin domain-containing protein [Candidatus Epulonipiscium sp.]
MINLYNLNTLHNNYIYHPCPYYAYNPMYAPMDNTNLTRQMNVPPPPPMANANMNDYGPEPFVINIEDATEKNTLFRTTLWTGENLQLTLMSIEAGDDIGLEIHPDHDQFIRIEDGQGLITMGDTKDNLDFQRQLKDNYIVIIPAGKWHNLINTGNKPLKLYSIYAPPEHPRGTVHESKAIADAAEAAEAKLGY